MNHFKELNTLRKQLRFLIDSSGHDKIEIGKLLDETREEYHKRVDVVVLEQGLLITTYLLILNPLLAIKTVGLMFTYILTLIK